MDYPRYRREGLPITSSLAESLVAEFNARVNSRRKFWNRPSGAEAMLQLRAALLSEDGRLERYVAERPGLPYRRKAKIARASVQASTCCLAKLLMASCHHYGVLHTCG
jgi:hypothetical protein